MISLKNKEHLLLMRQAGKITAGALEVARELVKPGESLISIDTHIRKFIEKAGAKPSFLGYGGFPASACISVNEEVIHGIPSDRRLEEGDIVKVDVGAFFKGFHGDAARTFFCGKVSSEAEKLERVTRESFLPMSITESATFQMQSNSMLNRMAFQWFVTMSVTV